MDLIIHAFNRSRIYACVDFAGGRYLQDLWVYNLNRLQWTAPAAEQQPDAAEGGEEEGAALLAPAGPPASAGWSVTPFQDKLLVLGGHVKVGKVCRDSRNLDTNAQFGLHSTTVKAWGTPEQQQQALGRKCSWLVPVR
jgi:hypothetical protein